MSQPHHPAADPRTEREQALRFAEQGLLSEETQVHKESAALGAAAQDLTARLEQARAAAARIAPGEGDPITERARARVEQGRVRTLDLAPHFDEAHAARAQAIQARTRALEAARQALSVWGAELSRIEGELSADEAALAASEQRAHEAATQRARAAAAARPQAPQAPAPAPQADPRGRRTQARVRMQAAVDLHTDSNFFTGFSTNLSEGGLFVATVQMPPLGTEVDLSFTLPGGRKLAVRGVVRWTREVNDNTPEIFPGAGIQFTDLDPATASVIHAFVQAREPMFYPE